MQTFFLNAVTLYAVIRIKPLQGSLCSINSYVNKFVKIIKSLSLWHSDKDWINLNRIRYGEVESKANIFQSKIQFLCLTLSLRINSEMVSEIPEYEWLFYYFFFSRQSLPLYLRVSWNSLCRTEWPLIQRSFCFCLSSAGFKGVHHYAQLYYLFL